MFIYFDSQNQSVKDVKQIDSNICIYIRGYIIWKDKLYQDYDFLPILNYHLNSNLLYDNIPKYNGCFNIVILNDSEITVINDRWGVFPLFYFKNEQKIIISDLWDSLLPYTKREFREDATYESLCFGYVMGNKTLIDGVYEFEPHSYYIINRKNNKPKIQKTSYWHLQHNFDVPKRHPKEFKDIWENRFKIFANHLKEKKYNAFVPLTAGLDSRLLATELDNNEIPIYGMTWGGSCKDIDIKTAFQLAPQINNLKEHCLIYLNQRTLNDMTSCSLTGNLITTLVFGQRFFYFQNRIKHDCSSWFPGHSGGFMSGGHLRYKMKFWKTKANIVDYILDFQAFAKLRNFLMNNDSKVKEAIYEGLKDTIPDDPDLISSYIRWDVEQKQRRYIIRSSISEPTELMYLYLPYYDYEIMDFFLNLPFSQLLNKNLKIKAMSDYIYKNKPEIKQIRNNGKPLKPIKNNLVHEYEGKIKNMINMLYGQTNKKEYKENIKWKEMADSLVLPEFLDKKRILENLGLNKKIQHLQNLSLLHKKIR
ncbi:MAG: hypothetical protein ACOCWW_00040 [Bacteroidota bacterium]